MDQHYRAFISYKHAPADIAVASEIQKRLERFHVPAAIRKKTGRNEIGRIFRDKEELPITSDLSEDISRALEDADFLIVICSSSTRSSTWVPREIDYFLQNHSKKQIFTVLVDGEPEEVIPERLLSETVTVTAEDGSISKETIRHEPLSCDFREGLKEAKKTEIPRLAAALLGCSYDELIRRERQYKRRRNLAIGIPAALALAVAIGYLIWSRQEISKNYQRAEENYQLAQENYQKAEDNYQLAQENYHRSEENYQQALINQSEYLCTQSKQMAEKGDRLRSILLAMEALPSEGNDRPLTSKAMTTLARSLSAYEPAGRAYRHDAIKTVAEYYVSGEIRQFLATDNGQYLVILDSYGLVHAWNVWTNEKLLVMGPRETTYEESSEKPILFDAVRESDCRLAKLKALKIVVISDDSFAVLTEEGVYACEFTSGQIPWSYEEKNILWDHSAFGAFPETGEVVLALSKDLSYYNGQEQKTINNSSLAMVSLDGKAGRVSAKIEASEIFAEQLTVDYVKVSRKSSDAAVILHAGKNAPSQIWIWQREKDVLKRIGQDRELSSVQNVSFVDEHRLCMEAMPVRNGDIAEENALYTQTYPEEILVSCHDLDTGDRLWENSFTSAQLNRLEPGTGLIRIGETDLLLCLYANKMAIFQLTDGGKYDETECVYSIVMGGVTVEDDVLMFLGNGCISTYNYEKKGRVINVKYLPYYNQGFTFITQQNQQYINYLAQPDSHRIWYCAEVYDDGFTRWTADPLPADIGENESEVTDHAFFLLDFDKRVYIYDIEDKKPAQVVQLEKGLTYKYLGADAASDTFWLYGYGNYKDPGLLIQVSADGTVKTVEKGPGLTDNEALAWISMTGRRAHGINSIQASQISISGTYDSLLSYGELPVLLKDARLAWRDGTVLKIGHLEKDQLVTEFSSETGYYFEWFFLSEDEQKVLLMDPGATAMMEQMNAGDPPDLTERKPVMVIRDFKTGEQIELEKVLYEDPMSAVWSGDGTAVAVTDGIDVAVYGADGKLIGQLSETGHNVISMGSWQDALIILYGGGLLRRFTWTDVSLIGQSQISYYEEQSDGIIISEVFSRFVSWRFTEDKLYLHRYGVGAGAFMIISLTDWQEELRTNTIESYDPLRDRLIGYEKDRDTDEKYLGWFPRYSAEDLFRKAEEALHGMTLTPEERKLYGLDD